MDVQTLTEPKIIIGIAGHFGSGKDAFGEELARALNEIKPGSAQIFKFADPLKEMAKKYFNWDGTKSEGTKYDGDGGQFIGGRKLLQGIGMMFREEVDGNFWVRKLLGSISKADCLYAVITDTRFINEARLVRESAGLMIRVVRTGYEGDNDPSEAQMRDPEFHKLCNMTISNDGPLKHLRGRARLLADTL
jgi:hypothetical protein